MSLIEDNEENRDKIVKVAEDLQGTTQTLEDALIREFGDGDDEPFILDRMPISLLEHLDAHVLECEVCGWWCEPDVVEDGTCNECADS